MTTSSKIIENVRSQLRAALYGTPALDCFVAYAIGLGDPTTRFCFEQFGPADRRCIWFPASYTSKRGRAMDLLREGKDWDRRAEGLTALEVCMLALEGKAAGLRPRKIERTTSGCWFEELEVKRKPTAAQLRALRQGHAQRCRKRADDQRQDAA